MMPVFETNCETEHDPPEIATYTISLKDSDSAANITFLCTLCVQEMSMIEDMSEYDVRLISQESESNA